MRSICPPPGRRSCRDHHQIELWQAQNEERNGADWGRRTLNDVRRRAITPARTVYPRREAILSEADGLSLSVSPGVNYRLGKSAWSLLGQIMTDAPFDQTVAVFARELLGIGRRLWVRGAICIALKGDCWHADGRAHGELNFHIVIFWLARSRPSRQR